MPPLSKLPPSNPAQAQGCQVVAGRIHLVHVTDGRRDRLTLGEVVRLKQIPTSADRRYCGDGTRFVEAQVGYPPSVYFYAGRACPPYGSIALAFPPVAEQGRVHSATPFGTGGIVKQQLGEAFRLLLNPDTLPDRVAYCKSGTTAGPGWRSEFALWLEFYYPSGPGKYWVIPPERPDPEQLYSLNAGHPHPYLWESWSWEVRFTTGPHAFEAEMWTAAPAAVSSIRREVAAGRFAPDEEDRCGEFMSRLLNPSGSQDFCQELEGEIRKRC